MYEAGQVDASENTNSYYNCYEKKGYKLKDVTLSFSDSSIESMTITYLTRDNAIDEKEVFHLVHSLNIPYDEKMHETQFKSSSMKKEEKKYSKIQQYDGKHWPWSKLQLKYASLKKKWDRLLKELSVYVFIEKNLTSEEVSKVLIEFIKKLKKNNDELSAAFKHNDKTFEEVSKRLMEFIKKLKKNNDELSQANSKNQTIQKQLIDKIENIQELKKKMMDSLLKIKNNMKVN